MVRVRHWRLWAPLLVAGMMVVGFLPGRDFDYSRGYWNRPRRHRDAVRRAYIRIQDQIGLLESRTALLRRAERAPAVVRGGLRVVTTADITPAQAAAWADALVADIGAVVHAEPRGQVIAYLATWDSLPALQAGTRRYWGSYGAIEEPCLSFIEATDERLASVRAGDSPMALGGCSFVLALGSPGPAIAGWLDASRRYDPLAGSRLNEGRYRVQAFESLGSGLRNCVDGSDDACRAAAARGDPRLLYWVLQHHGADALQRLWSGGPALEQAVAGATGRPLAEVARALINDAFDLSNFRSSRLSADHVTRAGLTAGLCLALSLLVGRRRRLT